MVLKVFTKEDSQEMEKALELAKKFEEERYSVEYYDADSAESTQQMKLYDIYSYPSFVVARDNGSEVECWRGKIPLKDDVVRFLNL
jgi:hypothetical protein